MPSETNHTSYIMRPRKSTLYHQQLLSKVKHWGVVMAFKCVSCQKSQSDCIRSDHSKSCLACLKRRRSCDMEPFSNSDFAKIDKERARLEAEEEALEMAEEEILKKQEGILQ